MYTRETENAMDMNVVEQVLSEAVERGALNADQVDEVVVQMRGADTDLAEAQAATQDRERRVAEALDRFNQATSSAVRLLNMAANN
jgi:polyhydroxyalkanoate synthesis regulator phasin